MKKLLTLFLGFILAFCFIPMQNYNVVNAMETNQDIISTYEGTTNLVNAPTVVYELQTKKDVDSVLESDVKPSNVIISFDENANAVAKNGEVISDFVSLHKSQLGKEVLFMARIESEESAQAFIDMMNETYSILDVAVISTKPALISKIKEDSECAHVRGAVEYTRKTDLYKIVSTTHENGAIIAVIPQSMATITNVRYIQARLKTVWVNVSDDSGLGLNHCINSGAYGIVSSDYSKVYQVLGEYKKGYTRTAFNIAHRGMPYEYNENSISGLLGAIEAGATHVELDGYLTKDKHIVMMHDSTLDRTTNGTGSVEAKTLDEIRQYKLDLIAEEEIPTFDDVAEVIKESNIVFIFEIKSSNREIVSVLQEKLYEHGIEDKVIVISFNVGILVEMKEVLPEVPTANLNTASDATFSNVLKWMGAYNTTVNTGSGNANASFIRKLRDHGIIGWFWTYGSFGEGTNLGVVGQTSNNARAGESLPMHAIDLSDESKIAEKVAVGDTLKVKFVTYAGREINVDCEVVNCIEYDDKFEVVCYYKMPIGLYTQTLTVTKPVIEDEKGGCSSSLGLNGVLGGCLLLAVTLLLKKEQSLK